MEKAEIGKKVLEILNQRLNEDGKPPATCGDSIGGMLSSVEFVALIIEIESVFDIEIDDDDFEIAKMDSVEKISELLAGYIN